MKNNSEEIFNRIKKLTVEMFGLKDPDRVTLDTHFENDLQADSLDKVELVMTIEEAFGFDIPDDKAEKIETVQQAVSYIINNQPKEIYA